MSAWPSLPYIESRIQALVDGQEALQGHVAVETRRSQEAERDAKALARKLQQTQKNLDAAKEELKRLSEHESDAAKAIKAAAAAVQSLTRQQLEEVRCLAQPPVVVKRALSLVHALLHAEDIPVDDPVLISDWDKLSQMLRKSLLQQVASFPPPEHPLAAHPHVRELIASQVEDADLHTDKSRARRTASLRKVVKRSKSISGPASARGKRISFAAVAEAALSHRRISEGRDDASPCWASLDQEGAENLAPRLSEQGVTFACRPVGILFRWLVQQLRYAEALLSHEESAELEEKIIREAKAVVSHLREALDQLRVEAEEAKARGDSAKRNLDHLSIELSAAQEEERQLREQRDMLQRSARRMAETEMVSIRF